MRCPSCNKFPSLTLEEPEVELQFDGELTVSYTVHLARNSECCGDECKTADFDGTVEIPHDLVKDHVDDKGASVEVGEDEEEHELLLDEGDVQLTERSEGKGRGLKTFYGFCAAFTVRCSCQKDNEPALFEGDCEDEIQASHMDEVS